MSLPPEVDRALDQEPDHMGDELRRVWDLTGIASANDRISSQQEIDAMWASIKPQTLQGATGFKEKKPISDRSPRRTARSARMIKTKWLVPALSLVLLVSFALYWLVPVTVSAERGELTEAYLPDGSVVFLNSGSSISYKRGFDGMPFLDASVRNLSITGEGFFDVAHSDVPFVVETFNANILVLGTQFNVQAWPTEPDLKSTISLISGRVAVSASNQISNQVILEEPGHTTSVRTSDLNPTPPVVENTDSAISWRERGLFIKSRTLVAVFSELERRYDITISVEDAQILDDSLDLLMPKPDNLESILTDICTEKNLKFRKTSRGYVIYRSSP